MNKNIQADIYQDYENNTWVSEHYFRIMMDREYQRGYKDGKKDIVHVAEIQIINQLEP